MESCDGSRELQDFYARFLSLGQEVGNPVGLQHHLIRKDDDDDHDRIKRRYCTHSKTIRHVMLSAYGAIYSIILPLLQKLMYVHRV